MGMYTHLKSVSMISLARKDIDEARTCPTFAFWGERDTEKVPPFSKTESAGPRDHVDTGSSKLHQFSQV